MLKGFSLGKYSAIGFHIEPSGEVLCSSRDPCGFPRWAWGYSWSLWFPAAWRSSEESLSLLWVDGVSQHDKWVWRWTAHNKTGEKGKVQQEHPFNMNNNLRTVLRPDSASSSNCRGYKRFLAAPSGLKLKCWINVKHRRSCCWSENK